MRFISALIIIALGIAGTTLLLHLMDMTWWDLFMLPW